jgi:hypothetical protein
MKALDWKDALLRVRKVYGRESMIF